MRSRFYETLKDTLMRWKYGNKPFRDRNPGFSAHVGKRGIYMRNGKRSLFVSARPANGNTGIRKGRNGNFILRVNDRDILDFEKLTELHIDPALKDSDAMPRGVLSKKYGSTPEMRGRLHKKRKP